MKKVSNTIPNILKFIFKTIGISLIFATIIIVLLSTIRGISGNPTPDFIVKNLRDKGKAFEVSPERGRYALLYSIVENKSFDFSNDLAAMAVPDLATINGKYVSLFAPGVSFIAIPFYIVGKYFQIAQVGAFATSAFFAFLNIILITIIAYKLSKNYFAGILAGISFCFGTVAWSYATTLYQHHITTFLLLSAFVLLLDKRHFFKDLLIGIIVGLSVFVEYPNVIFFIPLLCLMVYRHVEIKSENKKIKLSFFMSIVFSAFGLLIGMLPFFIYNKLAYDNPIQLAGTLKSVRSLEASSSAVLQPKTVSYKKKSALGFFKYERIPNGMDVLLTSKDRGLMYYGPIVIFGLLGFIPLWKKRKDVAITIAGVIVVFLGLYSTWGDPWGGWGFGPRYLIPLTAFLAILLSESIHYYGKKFWYGTLFFVIYNYSILVNLTGAITTHQLPPSVEQDSVALPQLQFLHNFELYYRGINDSFFYNSFLRGFISVEIFWVTIFLSLLTIAVVLYVLSAHVKSKHII